jgi:hypothetical protein
MPLSGKDLLQCIIMPFDSYQTTQPRHFGDNVHADVYTKEQEGYKYSGSYLYKNDREVE